MVSLVDDWSYVGLVKVYYKLTYGISVPVDVHFDGTGQFSYKQFMLDGVFRNDTIFQVNMITPESF